MSAFVWEVHLHWHPKATAAGVRPRDIMFDPRSAFDPEADPAFYLPLRWLFDAPPLAADVAVAVQAVAWFAYQNGGAVEAALAAAADWPTLDREDVILSRVSGTVRLGPADRPAGRVTIDRVAVHAAFPPPPPPRTRAVSRPRRINTF